MFNKKISDSMKYQYLFAAIAATTLLASCSQDETVEMRSADGIQFRTAVHTATRANALNKGADLQEFYVHGISETNSGLTFADKYTRNGKEWNAKKGVHYWPGDGSDLKFYAFSPASLATSAAVTKESQTINGFQPALGVADQKDLVVAYNEGNNDEDKAGITLFFSHALSQIEVKAMNLNPDVMKVEVVGVKIGNVKTNGMLTLPATLTQDNVLLSSDSWNLTNATYASYMAGNRDNEAVELKKDEAKSIMFGDNNFMVLPQQLTKWDKSKDNTNNGSYISVLCRISQNNGSGTYNQFFPNPDVYGKDTYGFAAVPINTKWEPGKKYTYTLRFFDENGGGGTTDPDPTDPVDPDPTDPEIPGGEDIVGGEIILTVDVDGWQDASDTGFNGDTDM